MASKGQLKIRIVGDHKELDQAMDKSVGLVKAGALAMGTAFAAGIAETMSMDAANDKLAAQLGLSEKASEKAGQIAGDLYADAYGDSIEGVHTAVGAVMSSIDGMRTASSGAVEDITAKVLDLNATMEIDTARAAQVAGQMIQVGFARDASQAMDLLAASMQKVPAAVREDLVDALDEYAPFMQTLGLQGERGMGLLVAAAEDGAFGLDKTGDALKQFTIRSTDMSTATQDAYDALGMSSDDMTKRLLAGGESSAKAFDEIVQGLRGMEDPAEQSAAALALFGTPLEDLGTDEIPKFLYQLVNAEGALDDTTGAADRLGDTLNDNAMTNMTSFWRQAKMAFVDLVGGKVIPIVQDLTGWLSNNFGPALSATVDWISRNKDMLGFLLVTVGSAITAYKTWTAVTRGMKGAQKLLNVALKANPIGIVITAVGSLVGGIIYLWNKSEGFRNFFTDAWDAIKRAVDAVGDAIGWVITKIREAIDWMDRLINNKTTGQAVRGTGFGIGRDALTALGRAHGGPVNADQPYVVGERGMELFVPGMSGTIVNHRDLAALMDQAESDSRTSLATLSSGARGAAPSAAPSGGSVRVELALAPGADEPLMRAIIKGLRVNVRTDGRGSAERFFKAKR